jgi:hypothetical protein
MLLFQDAWVCGLSARLPPAPVSPVITPSQLEPVGETSSKAYIFGYDDSRIHPSQPLQLKRLPTPAGLTRWKKNFSVERFLIVTMNLARQGTTAHTSVLRNLRGPSEPLEIINGMVYKYSAGSRPPLLFSLDVPDARYRYEGEPAATASPSSDASDPPRWANRNAHYATTMPFNNYQQPKSKGRKKKKKNHTQPTPVICSEEE